MKPRVSPRGLFTCILSTSSIQLPCNASNLQLTNRLRDLNVTWACHRAVKYGMATGQSVGFTHNLHTLGSSLVAAIEDKTMCGDQGGRAEIIVAAPVGWTGSGTSRAQNTFGGVVEAGALFG